MFTLSLFEVLVAVSSMFAGATVLSTVGFGLGMTATPFLLLVLEPQTVVVVLNTTSIALFLLIIFQSREHLDIRRTVPISVAGLLAVPVGVFVLSSVSAGTLRISITAAIILITVLVSLNLQRPLPQSDFVGAFMGFVVGALMASFGIGGPLIVLWMLAGGWSRQAMRATLAFYFIFIASTSAIGYAVAGLFTAERLILILIVSIPVAAGFGLGTILVRRMDERLFRRAVLVIILVTSLMVLGREIITL